MAAGQRTVIAVHNHYISRGGEDEVFEAEADLLERAGWRVIRVEEYTRVPHGVGASLRLARSSTWSPEWYGRFVTLVKSHRPDVVHVHNWFPMFSPSILYAASTSGASVVQTLHNYRLICPKATLFRDGRPCEDCVGRQPWPAIIHQCYQSSVLRTAVTAGALSAHRAVGTWGRTVDAYIVLTDFARARFVAGGMPAHKLFVKPNFLEPDPGLGEPGGEYAIFVGRLSPEKGVPTLLTAWQTIPTPLRVIGDGPLDRNLSRFTKLHDHVRSFGRMDHDRTIESIRGARLLVFPSECYEGFPLVLLEAFALGVPVIAARRGAAQELINEGETGFFFSPGDPDDLVRVIKRVWSHGELLSSVARNARRIYEDRFTGERNVEELMKIYGAAIANRRAHANPRGAQ